MEAKELVKKIIEDIWAGDYEQVKELIATEYHIFNDPGDPWEGKTIDHATYIERVEKLREMFPDLTFEIQDLIGGNDKVSVSWLMSGTHSAPLNGIPATNNKISVPGITIYTVANGVATGHWQVLDRISVFMQLDLS